MEKQRTKTEYKNDDLTIASKYVQKKELTVSQSPFLRENIGTPPVADKHKKCSDILRNYQISVFDNMFCALLLRALFRTIRQSGDFCALAAAFALEFVYVNNLCCCCVNDDDDLV